MMVAAGRASTSLQLIRTLLLAAVLGFGVLPAAAAEPLVTGLPNFVPLVKAQGPAVVNIRTVTADEDAQPDSADDLPEFFRRFMPGPDGNRQPDAPRRSRPGLGSGFILSADGIVVTNNHVVAGASEIHVRLMDRREFRARVVGVDERSDLAVLQLEADNLPTVTIGDSDALQVGEWVLAIGSPFGFDYSVTAGIVSAKGRSLPDPEGGNYVPFLQTDVAINPGNSGGPLFNLAGEVVGVNAQIYTRSGGFMGMSFAIPIATAMAVVEQLRQTGAVSRGWLGVQIGAVTPELAAAAGLDRLNGAQVVRVVEASPAASGGLLAGDLITRFDGEPLRLSSDLPHVVGAVRAGVTVPVDIVRDGVAMTLQVTLGELPETPAAALAEPEVADPAPELGLEMEPVPAELLASAGLEAGVQVAAVGPGPAASAGLLPGDIILRLDNQPVPDVASFQNIAKVLQAGRPVPLLVLRDGQQEFLALTP